MTGRRFETVVALDRIERDRPRPGFGEPYHRLVFKLSAEGAPPAEYSVFVHRAYPEDRLEAVGRAFLAARLDALADAAFDGAMEADAIDALWKSLGPPPVL